MAKSGKNEIAEIRKYLQSLLTPIELGIKAVPIQAIDYWAFEFMRLVVQDLEIVTGYNRLKGEIELVPYVRGSRSKRRNYGYWLKFDGYDDTQTPLQLIANVLNTGRAQGAGVAKTGRRYAYGEIKGIKFMTRNLEVLRNIDKEIAERGRVANWIITPNHIVLSDGTKMTISEMEALVSKLPRK